MKKAEILFTSLIFIGFIFRLKHWPFASEIISLNALLLANLYLFFGFALLNSIRFRAIFKKESYLSISKLRVFVGICTGCIFSMLVIYCLFKIQFWPFGQIGLQQSLILFGIVLLITLIFNFFKRKQFLKTNYIRFIIIGVISITIYSITTDQLVDLYYGNDPEYAEDYKAYLKGDSINAKRPTREFKSK